MTYMPDTNVWIKLLNSRPTPVKGRFLSTSSLEIGLCSIVLAELYFGAYKSSRRHENLETVNKLKSAYRIYPFDEKAANIYGRVRAELSMAGNLIGPNDLMIASVALANDVVMITHNTRVFARIAGLRLLDWEDSE